MVGGSEAIGAALMLRVGDAQPQFHADDEVSVRIHDEGPGFDPDDVPVLPEPDDPDRLLHERGLGVHLMHLLADESSITSDGAGTEVKLTMYSARRRNRG